MILIGALVVNISLSSLFVYKLIQVIKDEDTTRNNGRLLDIITKNTILTLISNSATLLVIVGIIVNSIIPNHGSYWIFSMNVLVQFLDVYTNFICIAFTFKCFISWYNGVCGKLDYKCKKCCSMMFMSESLAAMQNAPSRSREIEMTVSSPSSEKHDIEMAI